MAEVTVFVHIQGRQGENPVACAISGVAKTVGDAVIVESVVDDDQREASIAVVDTVEAAQRAVQETEQTIVFLAFLDSHLEGEFRAYASRANGRVIVAPYIPLRKEGEKGLVTLLLERILELRERGS